MSTKISEATKARLQETECGRVLLSLLDQFGDYPGIAKAAGVDNQTVRVWFYKGAISVRGAEKLAAATCIDRKVFRPDIADEAWDKGYPGPIPGHKPRSQSADAKLLVSLKAKFGTVAEVCRAAGIGVADYHLWKSRGRIPALKLPALLALK